MAAFDPESFEGVVLEKLSTLAQGQVRVETMLGPIVDPESGHDARLKVLEASSNKAQGFFAGVKWLWGVVIALAGIFGWHIVSKGH